MTPIVSIQFVAMIPPSANTNPIDRSNSPTISVIVNPNDTMPGSAAVLSTSRKLSQVGNVSGFFAAKKMTMRTRKMSGP